MTPEQEARLPVYARREVERLRRDLAEARADAALRVEHEAGAGAWVNPYGAFPRAVAGRYERVRFAKELDARRWLDVHRDSAGLFEVMVSGGLTIHPQVSNVIRIEVRE